MKNSFMKIEIFMKLKFLIVGCLFAVHIPSKTSAESPYPEEGHSAIAYEFDNLASERQTEGVSEITNSERLNDNAGYMPRKNSNVKENIRLYEANMGTVPELNTKQGGWRTMKKEFAEKPINPADYARPKNIAWSALTLANSMIASARNSTNSEIGGDTNLLHTGRISEAAMGNKAVQGARMGCLNRNNTNGLTQDDAICNADEDLPAVVPAPSLLSELPDTKSNPLNTLPGTEKAFTVKADPVTSTTTATGNTAAGFMDYPGLKYWMQYANKADDGTDNGFWSGNKFLVSQAIYGNLISDKAFTNLSTADKVKIAKERQKSFYQLFGDVRVELKPKGSTSVPAVPAASADTSIYNKEITYKYERPTVFPGVQVDGVAKEYGKAMIRVFLALLGEKGTFVSTSRVTDPRATRGIVDQPGLLIQQCESINAFKTETEIRRKGLRDDVCRESDGLHQEIVASLNLGDEKFSQNQCLNLWYLAEDYLERNNGVTKDASSGAKTYDCSILVDLGKFVVEKIEKGERFDRDITSVVDPTDTTGSKRKIPHLIGYIDRFSRVKARLFIDDIKEIVVGEISDILSNRGKDNDTLEQFFYTLAMRSISSRLDDEYHQQTLDEIEDFKKYDQKFSSWVKDYIDSHYNKIANEFRMPGKNAAGAGN